MWLYVPSQSGSTSSASAQGDLGSTLPSNSPFHALAPCLWWRGKPSPLPIWLRRSNKVDWLRQLSGRMCDPSTAEHGVALWMASLAASRANLTASPESGSDERIHATFGARRGASSSSPAPGSSSLKMSAVCSHRAARNASYEIWSDLVSRVRSDCSRRQKSVRRISGNGSSSSVWPTATANMTTGAGSSGREGGDNLQTAVALWPTPNATDGEKGSAGQIFAGGNPSLTREAFLWSTPRSSDGEKGGPNQSFSAGGVPLPAQASQWMTPRSHEVGQYQYSRGDKMNPVATLTGQALAIYSPLALVTVKTGKPHSRERRSLNPLFVEWLMGWPPGWTLLASTDFGCSETALSAWKARMRSALLQLGLPDEAPPAQLALFG
jgi:hypothetical protein